MPPTDAPSNGVKDAAEVPVLDTSVGSAREPLRSALGRADLSGSRDSTDAWRTLDDHFRRLARTSSWTRRDPDKQSDVVNIALITLVPRVPIDCPTESAARSFLQRCFRWAVDAHWRHTRSKEVPWLDLDPAPEPPEPEVVLSFSTAQYWDAHRHLFEQTAPRRIARVRQRAARERWTAGLPPLRDEAAVWIREEESARGEVPSPPWWSDDGTPGADVPREMPPALLRDCSAEWALRLADGGDPTCPQLGTFLLRMCRRRLAWTHLED